MKALLFKIYHQLGAVQLPSFLALAPYYQALEDTASSKDKTKAINSRLAQGVHPEIFGVGCGNL